MSGLKTVTKKSGAYQLRNIPKMFEGDKEGGATEELQWRSCNEGAAGLKNELVGLSDAGQMKMIMVEIGLGVDSMVYTHIQCGAG